MYSAEVNASEEVMQDQCELDHVIEYQAISVVHCSSTCVPTIHRGKISICKTACRICCYISKYFSYLHHRVAFSTSFFSSPWDDCTPITFASTTKEMPPRMLFSVLINDVSTLKVPGDIFACATCAVQADSLTSTMHVNEWYATSLSMQEQMIGMIPDTHTAR